MSHYLPPKTPQQAKANFSPNVRPPAGRERRSERTVYVLSGDRPKPVQIKTGISDGAVTEVLEGLSEGDQVVTGLGVVEASARQTFNPFLSNRKRH